MRTRRQHYPSRCLWWFLLSIPVSAAFVLQGCSIGQRQDTSLFFQNNSTDSGPVLPSTFVEIPVIGPLLNAAPLIIGGSMWLSPPTPLQWKTIEVCVEAQHASSDSEYAIATVSAAPLVAVLQEGGESVTIAAIEGIVTDESQTIDTRDAISFRESLASCSSSFYSESSRIRLFGVGRAMLSEFTTREEEDSTLANEQSQKVETNNIPLGNGAGVEIRCEDEEEIPSESEDPILREPVLMARMKLLLDSNTVTDTEFSARSSPVHALSQLSMWASRIGFLHEDRQRRIKGLQAAQSRLDMASKGWKDWDGIGTLFGEEKMSEGTTQFDPEEEYQKKIEDMLQTFAGDHSRPLTPEAANLVQLDNYGLTGNPYSDLQALTKVLVEKLQVYYSPQLVQTEEFRYSIFSWVALRSLQVFLEPQDLQKAMKSTNTCERLELVYDAMMRHKDALQELAQAKSQELLDCGEECTDLF